MKKLFVVLALILPMAAVAQAPPFPESPLSYTAGRFVAANYSKWSLQINSFPAGTGSQTFTLVNPTVRLLDGRGIMPFNTNAPILVGSENVTPTAVVGCTFNNPAVGACQITATFSQQHSTSDSVRSATAGLQEALNDASLTGGGAVVIDATWTNAGGTTAIKNAATLPTNTGIEDARTGAPSGGGGGANFPSTPGVVFNTSTSAARNATGTDVNTLIQTFNGCGAGLVPFSTFFPGQGNCVPVVPTGNLIYTSVYGVKGDGVIYTDATWTAPTANPTITISGSDTPFTAAMNGKDCVGTVGGASGITKGGNFTFVSSTTGTCNGITSSNAATSTGVFEVGSNNDAAFALANAALQSNPACGLLVLPAGNIMVSQGFGNTISTSALCNRGLIFPGDVGNGYGMTGQGSNSGGSSINPEPGFDFTTCSTVACFMGANINNLTLSNFSINGLQLSGTGLSTSPATSLMGNLGTAPNYINLQFTNWMTANTTVNGLSALGQSGALTGVGLGLFGGAGSTGCQFSINGAPGPLILRNLYAQGSGRAMCITTGSNIIDHDSGYNGGFPSLVMQAGVTYNGTGIYIADSASGATGVQMAGTDTVYMTGGFNPVLNETPGSTYKAFQFTGAGSVLYLQGVSIRGGTGTTGGSITGNSGLGQVVDLGGNYGLTPGSPISGLLTNYSGGWSGTGSITGKAQTSANVALTSGWGTGAAVSAVSGNTKLENFTITAAGIPGANPVLTVTFPTPFLFQAPQCNLVQQGGTLGIIAQTAAPTATLTTATITFAGTPVATQTYAFQLFCDNP